MRADRKLVLGFAAGTLAMLTLLALLPRPLHVKLAALRGDETRIAQIYHRIDDKERPIDVAFIGSSHTALGVDDRSVEAALRQQGLALHVANLGVFGIGRDLQLMLVKELYAHQQPELLVVEINDHESPNGHPSMPSVGTLSDLLAPGLAWNLPHSMLLFLRTQLFGLAESLLPGVSPIASPPPDLSYQAYGWYPVDGAWNGTGEGPVSAEDKVERLFGPRARRLLERAMAPYGDHAIAEILALARAHRSRVLFNYLPERKYALAADPDLIARYTALAPVFVLPRQIAEPPANWWEPTHLNRDGASKLTLPLSRAIAAELAPAAAKVLAGEHLAGDESHALK